jgi:hypothetical protein
MPRTQQRRHLKSPSIGRGGEFGPFVSPHELLDANGYLRLEMAHAVRFNELVRLGDLSIGTAPPLKLRLTADSTKPNTIGADGVAPFTIGEVTIFSEDRPLASQAEQEIAGYS